MPKIQEIKLNEKEILFTDSIAIICVISFLQETR